MYHLHHQKHSSTTNKNMRIKIDITGSATWSVMLTMAAFDNALGLPEGVDLCLAFQHHLISMSYVQGGERKVAPLQPC